VKKYVPNKCGKFCVKIIDIPTFALGYFISTRPVFPRRQRRHDFNRRKFSLSLSSTKIALIAFCCWVRRRFANVNEWVLPVGCWM